MRPVSTRFWQAYEMGVYLLSVHRAPEDGPVVFVWDIVRKVLRTATAWHTPQIKQKLLKQAEHAAASAASAAASSAASLAAAIVDVLPEDEGQLEAERAMDADDNVMDFAAVPNEHQASIHRVHHAAETFFSDEQCSNEGLFEVALVVAWGAQMKYLHHTLSCDAGRVDPEWQGKFEEVGVALEALESNVGAESLISEAVNQLKAMGRSVDVDKITAKYVPTILDAATASKATFDKYYDGIVDSHKMQLRYDPRVDPGPMPKTMSSAEGIRWLGMDPTVHEFTLHHVTAWAKYQKDVSSGWTLDFMNKRAQRAEGNSIRPQETEPMTAAGFWTHPEIIQRYAVKVTEAGEPLHPITPFGAYWSERPTSSMAGERGFGKMRGWENFYNGSTSAESLDEGLLFRCNKDTILTSMSRKVNADLTAIAQRNTRIGLVAPSAYAAPSTAAAESSSSASSGGGAGGAGRD